MTESAGGGRGALRADLVAGLCVAGLLLPEAVAYAGLARLPVSHGLMACVVGLGVYALLGRSRDAVVSPTSSSASMAAAAAAGVAGMPFVDTLMALTIAAGGVLILLAVMRQGQLSAFISRPVLRGVAFAVALTVVIRQLPDLLGLAPPPGLAPLPLLAWVLGALPHSHAASVAVALGTGALVALLKRWPQWPGSLLAMLIAIAVTRLLDLPGRGVETVGLVVLPPLELHLPALSDEAWLDVGERSVGLVVLVFAESWGSIRALALRRGDSPEANRELFALGAANVACGLLHGMPVGAGFSASSANYGAGAASRRAGVVAALGIVAILLFALPVLRWLPRPVLAVAVAAALWHSLSPKPLLAAWALRRDRLALVGAVLAVLVLGLLHGMLVAVALSLVEALRRFSQPLVQELAVLPNSRDYVSRNEHPEARAESGVLVLRPLEPLFFANAERIAAVSSHQLLATPARTLVLSLEESGDLDGTATECLVELDQRLAGEGRRLVLARVKDAPRELLRAAAPDGLGRGDRLYWSVADAVDGVRG